MATVWSGYTSTGTYTKTRVRVEYSGTSATAILCYTRTNTYTGSTGGTGTFSFGGASVSYNKWFTGQQTDAEVARVSFGISTAGGWYSGSSTGAATYLAFNGGVTIPAQTSPPTGLSVSINSRTWNSVSLTGKVSSWGTPNTGKDFYIGIMASNASSNWHDNAVSESGTGSQGSATSITRTINNSSQQTRGGYTAKGCKAFKIGAYCSNGSIDSTVVHSTIYYFPPAPLSALSVTSQSGSSTANSVTVNFSMTGGNSTNNENVTVGNEYRYSSDNGSTWSGWTSLGTGSPWTAKTGSFTVQYGKSCKIQARQSYQGLYSETKELSFSSTACTAPSGGTVQGVSATWNTITIRGTLGSYGKPIIANDHKIAIGVHSTPGSGTYKRENQLADTLDWTTTITNSSIYPAGNAINIVGCMKLYPYVWGYNGVCSAMTPNSSADNSITTPPSPMDRIVLNENRAVGAKALAKLTAYGSTANNLSGQTVKTQYRYSIGDDSSYTSWTDVNSTSEAPGNGKVINLTDLPPSTTVYVQTRQYQEITNPGDPITSTFITKQTPPSVEYSWNDVRDTITISTSVESAVTRLQILYGYSDVSASTVIADANNATDIVGSIQYPKHDGQAIYAKARLYYPDGTYDESEMKVIPVPHPILGVVRYPDGHQEYIVDIVERKANGTLTPQWQSGERVITAKPPRPTSS